MTLALAWQWLQELLRERQPPCVSIYLPVERAKPPADQNRMVYRDLVDRAQEIMLQRYKRRQIQPIMQRLRALESDEIMRGGPRDALSIFASPDYFRIVELQRKIAALVEVANSFHVKPLIRALGEIARFQVLCISPRSVRLYEGDRHQLREVELAAGVPRDIFHTLEGLRGGFPNEAYGSQTMRSHLPPTDKDHMGLEHFLRAVDNAIWEHHLRESRLPVIVCADEKVLAEFLRITKNEHVTREGIDAHPDHISEQRLREQALAILQRQYEADIEAVKNQFRVSRAHQKGSDVLPQVIEAAVGGRVATLLIDADRTVPGVLHRASGIVETPTSNDARADDVLDDLAELVLKSHGEVYVVAHDRMPTDTGVAAVFRY